MNSLGCNLQCATGFASWSSFLHPRGQGECKGQGQECKGQGQVLECKGQGAGSGLAITHKTRISGKKGMFEVRFQLNPQSFLERGLGQ